MAHFALLWKARTIEKYRIKYENEKINSIAMADIELPKRTVLQKWRTYRFDTQKRISKTFRQLYPEGSSLSNFITYLKTKQTFTNVLKRAVFGFIGGYVLSYLCFIFFVYQLSISVIYATVLSFIIGILLTVGLAFSHRIRCLIFLLIPQFFSRVGRYTLTCYALVLILTGPATNTLKNSEVLSESMACSQEQIKTSLNHLNESMEKPHNFLKAPILLIVETTKKISSKLNEVMIKINRLLLSMVSAIKMNFAWLNSIAINCNHKLGTPRQHCAKVLEKSVKYCEQMFGAVSRFCDVSYLARATCDGTKAFDTFCGVSEFVDDCILATVRRRLKEFSERVKAMMYVEVYIYHSYLFNANTSRSASQVAAGIVTEIRNRADPLLTWLSWSSCVTSLFLLLIIFRAKYYQHMYETRSRFDNRYVTKELRDLDLKRLREGRETILPLNRREKAKYINITSFRLLYSERTYLSRSVVFMTITTFKLLIHMVADYSLYWVLTTIRYYGSFQTPLQAELPHSAFYVSNSGFVSRFIKSIVNILDIPLMNTESAASCLPNPHPPDFRRYMQIGVLIFMLWFFALFEPYGLRLRHVIMSHYRPERARERAMWLYNHILRTRGSYMKFARRKLHREYKYKGETESTFRMYLCTYLPFTWLRFFLGIGCEELKCLLCGTVQSKTDFDTHLIRCKTKECPGTYCSSCFSEIGQLCTICLSPEDYGDISDVSLEKGSSGESSGSDDDDSENRNLMRESDDKESINNEDNTVQHIRIRKYERLFPKPRKDDDDNFSPMPYTSHRIMKTNRNVNKETKNTFSKKNHDQTDVSVVNNTGNELESRDHKNNVNGTNIYPCYILNNIKQACSLKRKYSKNKYTNYPVLKCTYERNTVEVQYITSSKACETKGKIIDEAVTIFLKRNHIIANIYKGNKDNLLLLHANLNKIDIYSKKLRLDKICMSIFLITENIYRQKLYKRYQIRRINQGSKVKLVSSLKDMLGTRNVNSDDTSTITLCFGNKRKKSEGLKGNSKRDKKKSSKNKKQRSKEHRTKSHIEPNLKIINNCYKKGLKGLGAVCRVYWHNIKSKDEPPKFYNAKTKLQYIDGKKNYKRRKKFCNFFRSKKTEKKEVKKKKDTDEARKLRISAYFLDQDWFKKKYDIISRKNLLDNATSDPALDLQAYKKLLTLKKSPPMYQMAKCTNSGMLRINRQEDESCCTDSSDDIAWKNLQRSKLNITKKALQRFRDRIKRKFSIIGSKQSILGNFGRSFDYTRGQATGKMREQVDFSTETYVEYVPSIMSHDESIDRIFEDNNMCCSKENFCAGSFRDSYDSAPCCRKSGNLCCSPNTSDKYSSACHKWMNSTRAISDRLVNAGVKTPIKKIKDLCVSLFDGSSGGETIGRQHKVEQACKGITASPAMRSFSCQYCEEKPLRDNTTQIGRRNLETQQWRVQNTRCDATMNTTKQTCTCATQHHIINKDIGTWLGHHCNELHRAAREHKRKMAMEKSKGPRRSVAPKVISEVFDISQEDAEASLNTTESSANETLICRKSESSINSNDTKTDTTICSIATVEYHEERKYKRRKPKTVVVTKANRSTLTDKAKVCDVSTITNDWWSPIVQKKEMRREKEICLEKKQGDYTMNEKVHKRLRNKGVTTDGRIVTFKSRTQVIPPGIIDIMSPSRYLLESQRYYNELFSSRFFTPHVYSMAQMQKHQENDKNRSSNSIKHHTRRGHKNKKYDESYSKRIDSIKMESRRRRLQPNVFKQNKIYRSSPRTHNWKKVNRNKNIEGKHTQNNIKEKHDPAATTLL